MNTIAAVDPARCPRCGNLRDASLPDGFCARCALAFALEDEPGPPDGELGATDSRTESAVLLNRRIGRYELRAEIDRGGVGVVYRAWQADLKREVALKMLLPSRLETIDALTRFRREAELMASLDHPGILPVYEVGEHNGLPYYSMKLAEGGNLATRTASLHGQFRECARLVAVIARAVDYAHGRGVLHRDLKPSNIVFDSAGQCMVTDFGLARRMAVDSSLTGIDMLIGTPRYVAPEVVTTAGAQLTAAADVYGLGAIFYELLGGRAPFADLTPLQILQQIATRRPRPPRQFDKAIPVELETICLRCLEKHPQDRHASAGAVADALQAWLGGAKNVASGRLGRLRLDVPSRRRRALALLALLAVSAGAALAIRYVTREPFTIPEAAVATRTVAVLPAAPQRTVAAAREAARQLAARLELPPTLRLLPFEPTLTMFSSDDFPATNDVDAMVRLGAFVAVDVVQLDEGNGFAVRARDRLRGEKLFEADFTLADAGPVARDLAAALAQRRAQPTPEAHLSRSALASLLHGMRWPEPPNAEINDATIAALKEAIGKAPDSALAHVWLALGYHWREIYGGETFWGDSVIDEAARARRLDPALAFAAEQLGAAYYRKDWITRALAAHEQARALGSITVNGELCILYVAVGRYADSYRACREDLRFGNEDHNTQLFAAYALFAVGETDAGERMLRVATAHDSESDRAEYEAQIAAFRGNYARCRMIAAAADPPNGGRIRDCAAAQGDFAAALATLPALRQDYATSRSKTNGNPPELREAILRARLNQPDQVPALLASAVPGLQAAIDSGSELPPVWLRMAAAQRLAGETDTAYATLEHAFALGLTYSQRHRLLLAVEFLPFLGDARFQALRAKSEAQVEQQRREIVEMLDPAQREPVDAGPDAGQGLAAAR